MNCKNQSKLSVQLDQLFGGTGIAVPTDAQKHVRQMELYIGMMNKICNSFRLTGTDNWMYACYEEIVQKYGQYFLPNHLIYQAGVYEDSRFVHAVKGLRSGMTYCEGYVLLDGKNTPIDHAWLYCQKSKQVIDFTYGTRANLYFGIPFSTDFVLAKARETGYASIFNSDLDSLTPILRDGVPDLALAELT
jgi:hypothetical protein